jgi:hypothetical protein
MANTAEPNGRDRKAIEVAEQKTELVLSAEGKTIEEKPERRRWHIYKSKKTQSLYQLNYQKNMF